MTKAIYTNLDFQSASKILNLPNPTGNQDAATKLYVDNLVEGLAWKDSCRVATSSNINIASPSGSIDGVSLTVNDRVLLRGQTTQSQNGIYIWNGAATPMSRALDASTSAELEQAITTIEEGTDAGASFRQTAINFTLDTDPVLWTAFGTAAPAASETTAGIAELATQAETDAGTDDLRIVTPLKLKTYSGGLKKFSQTFGDGSATQYTITHNLGTNDVMVDVFRNSGNFDSVECDIERTSINAVRITMTPAPASNAFRAIIRG